MTAPVPSPQLQQEDDRIVPEVPALPASGSLTMDEYPRECPRCQGALPVTRGVFPLRFSFAGILTLICGAVLMLASVLTLLPLIGLIAGFVWFPGRSMFKAAFNMRRMYHVTCKHCGFGFRVKGPQYD